MLSNKFSQNRRLAAVSALLAINVCGWASASEPFEYATQQVLAPGGQAGDLFGYSIALGNGYLAVGAAYNSDEGEEAGAVYVYNAGSGAFLYKLTAADADSGDRFGFDVAIDGDRLIVSAPYDHADGTTSEGSMYVFDLSNGSQFTKLIATADPYPEVMGWSVAIAQDAVVAGAISGRNTSGVQTGAVYAFSTQFYAQLVRFSPADGTDQAAYGSGLAITGSYLAVGAPYMDNGIGKSGAVYLYSYTSGELLHKLIPSDARVDQSFGAEVAISGDRIFVGSPHDDEHGLNSGSVYVFDAVSGAQIIKIPPHNPGVIDWFGDSIAVDGDTLLISAPYDDDRAQSSGAVFVYDADTYGFISKIKLSDAVFDDRFGTDVAAADGRMAASADRRDDLGADSGAAYLITQHCFPDTNGDGHLDFFDVSAFIGAETDYNGDGIFNFFDLSAFMNDYQAGCP